MSLQGAVWQSSLQIIRRAPFHYERCSHDGKGNRWICKKLVDRALSIRRLYEEKEHRLYGSPWTNEEIALGFVGDVGDLAKLIVAENGKRNIPESRNKLEHELTDCLWSVIVLANLYGIDLEKIFLNTMDSLQTQIEE